MLEFLRRPAGAGLLSLAIVALPHAAAAGEDGVVTRSAQRVLTAGDYHATLVGRQPAELAQLAADPQKLEDLALDFHSDVVLAAEAEQLGLDGDPKVAAQLAHVRRQVLIGALMDRAARDAVRQVGSLEKLARERYLLQKEQLVLPEQRQVSHILLTDAKPCACDPQPPALERARALREQLVKGADFAQAAREYSQDAGTAALGGRIPGWIDRDARLVKPFLDAAFALDEVGSISEPVETEFGVHLITLVDLQPSRQLPFEEVRDKLVQQLVTEIVNSAKERKRSEAYPDPDTIDVAAISRIVEQLRQAP